MIGPEPTVSSASRTAPDDALRAWDCLTHRGSPPVTPPEPRHGAMLGGHVEWLRGSPA